jgi:hypothetical protein
MAEADPDAAFREEVRLARLVDPMPTLRALAGHTGTEVDDVVHLALVRYASDGAEALLALGPASLRELVRARQAEDWVRVAGIIDWLQAEFESPTWRHP